VRIVDGSELQLAPGRLRLLSRRPRYCDPDEPLPFEEVLAPFVKEARPAIAADGLLVEDAQAALERLLLQRLTSLSSRTLYLEFSMERARRLSPLGRLIARAGDDSPRHVYESFVERMLGGDLDGSSSSGPRPRLSSSSACTPITRRSSGCSAGASSSARSPGSSLGSPIPIVAGGW
jgi:hypothetical protein